MAQQIQNKARIDGCVLDCLLGFFLKLVKEGISCFPT